MDGDLDPFIEAFLKRFGSKLEPIELTGVTTGFIEAARREKLKELLERGVVPFAYRFERHRDRPTGARRVPQRRRSGAVRLAGRLVALGARQDDVRAPGGSERQDPASTSRATSSAPSATRCWSCSIWATMWASKPLMKTRTGEITLRVAGFTLLSKALRPLPLGKEDASGVKHGELTDPELRSRQRYADLAVHPEVREVFPAAHANRAGHTGHSSMPRGTWKWKRPCCSRSTAAPRRGPSDALRSPGRDFLPPHRR